MSSILLTVLVGAMLSAAPDPAPGAPADATAPKTWAVVVGVGELADPRLGAVPHGPADAERVRDLLTTQGGLPAERVLLLSDGGVPFLDVRSPATALPTRRNVRLALTAWLQARVRDGDLVVFSYSGQGATGPGGEALLVTSDAAQADLLESAVDAAWVMKTLAALPGEAVLWLDTSFAGRGAPGARASSPAAIHERVPPGVALWLAAAGDAIAVESGPHGAFTRALVQGLSSGASADDAWQALVAALPERAPRPLRAGAVDLGRLMRGRVVRERPELVLQVPHFGEVSWASFDPSGRLLATSAEDATLKLWSASDLRIMANLEAPGRSTMLSWSPDGQRVLAEGPHGIKAWSAAGRELWSVPRDAALWPARAAIMREAMGPLARFSQDGTRVAVPSRERTEIRAADDGRIIAQLPPRKTADGPALWDPRGRWLALPSFDRTDVLLFDTKQWRVRAELSGDEPVMNMVWANQADTLAVARLDPEGEGLGGDYPAQRLTLYDAARDFVPRPTAQPIAAILPPATDRAGRLLAASTAHGVSLVRLDTLARVELGRTASGEMVGGLLQFSADGKLLAVFGADDTRLYDLAGTLVGTIAGEALALSPDLSAALSGTSANWGDGLALKDLRGRHPPRPLEARARPIVSLDSALGPPAGPEGARTPLVIAKEPSASIMWDLASGRPVERIAASPRARPTLEGRHPGYEGIPIGDGSRLVALYPEVRFPYALCELAPDKSRCVGWDEAVPADAYDIVLWDVERAARRAVLRGHRAPVTGLWVSDDGKTLISASLDTTLRVWDVAGARLLATVALLPGDAAAERWVIMTPDGLFDGSPQGQSEMQWRVGDTLFRLEQYAGELYTPGLFARLVAGERPKAALAVEELLPPPRVRIVSPARGAAVADGVVAVETEVEDAGGGKSPAWLYVNGRRVPATRARPLRVGGREAFEVELVEGQNHLRATAFNSDGTIESAGDEINVTWDVPEAERPVLYVVAVGVDDYEDATLRLSFAGADAKAISQAFSPGLFARVEPTLLTNRQATRGAITAAIARVAALARPRDVLVVYLAGHGALIGSTFFFLPADAKIGSDDMLAQSSLSQAELAQTLMQVPAQKQVVVLDACHSGAGALALGRMIGMRDALGLARAQRRLARASGVFLVAASTAAQKAGEIQALGHGILTYAFLAGLGASDKHPTPGARTTPDGHVTMNALLAWLDAEVPRLTARHQGSPQTPVQSSTGQDFPIVRVDRTPWREP